MRKLTLTDASFLISESRQTPMHVGGLNLFTMPDGVNETEYLHEIAQKMRYQGALRFPFGDILKMGPLGVYGNIYLERDRKIHRDGLRHFPSPSLTRTPYAAGLCSIKSVYDC